MKDYVLPGGGKIFTGPLPGTGVKLEQGFAFFYSREKELEVYWRKSKLVLSPGTVLLMAAPGILSSHFAAPVYLVTLRDDFFRQFPSLPLSSLGRYLNDKGFYLLRKDGLEVLYSPGNDHFTRAFFYLKLLELSLEALREIESLTRVWSVREVFEHITLNYADHFSLEDLARRCALNITYFSREFKEVAGYPLFEFINRTRINRACQLLKNTGRSILEISLDVGYNNVSFFNRYFKRIMNLSPKEYRKKVRN